MSLPIGWIERIFERLSGIYGRKFSDMWTGVDVDVMKREWGVALYGSTPSEIGAAIDACRRREWPPTLPEFLMLVKPRVDAEALFVDAQRAMSSGEWGDNRLAYWVTQCVGPSDVRAATWFHIRRRWEKALVDAMSEHDLPPIPDAHVALPAPGRTTSKDVAAHHLAIMKRMVCVREAA